MTRSVAVHIAQTIAVTAVGAALALAVIAAGALAAYAPRGAARSPAPNGRERRGAAMPSVPTTPTTTGGSAAPQPVTVMIVASVSQAAAVQEALDQAAPLLVTSGASSPRTVYVVLSADAATPAVTADGNLVAQLVDLRAADR